MNQTICLQDDEWANCSYWSSAILLLAKFSISRDLWSTSSNPSVSKYTNATCNSEWRLTITMFHIVIRLLCRAPHSSFLILSDVLKVMSHVPQSLEGERRHPWCEQLALALFPASTLAEKKVGWVCEACCWENEISQLNFWSALVYLSLIHHLLQLPPWKKYSISIFAWLLCVVFKYSNFSERQPVQQAVEGDAHRIGHVEPMSRSNPPPPPPRSNRRKQSSMRWKTCDHQLFVSVGYSKTVSVLISRGASRDNYTMQPYTRRKQAQDRIISLC